MMRTYTYFKFNEKMLSELKVTTPDNVGKLFCRFAPFLKMYVSILPMASRTIEFHDALQVHCVRGFFRSGR